MQYFSTLAILAPLLAVVSAVPHPDVVPITGPATNGECGFDKYDNIYACIISQVVSRLLALILVV